MIEKVMICDRCGKQGKTNDNYCKLYNKFVKLSIYKPLAEDARDFDLCEKCLSDLIAWFKNGGGKI